jgi:UDP-N-acetylmuramoyl-tripeptide--D-alanyl-D-alanine ligase
MTFLSTTWVARALGQTPPETERHLTQITSDSRAVKPGALFVALIGENTDGHNFVDKARAAGASAIVHLPSFTPPSDMASFPVKDTLEAWRKLSQAWRKEFRIPVAVVAGSAGKTTSKELLAALFRGRWQNVLKTEGSQNGFQGVPTTLLRLSPEHEAAVIEVGIDEPNAMIQHLELVQPDCGLLTSIGPEHLEKLIDLDTVEREEGLLFKILEKNKGFAAVNLDDERIVNQAAQLKAAHSLTYSLRQKADVRGYLHVAGESIFIDVEGLSGQAVRFPVPLEGAHNALNLLGAISLSHGLGLSPAEMLAGLNTFTPPPGRSEVHHWQGAKVLADTYNANPTSVEAALETLFAGAPQGETWVCLGDMLEMGALEEQLHRGLASPILKHGVRHVLLFGPRMKSLQTELKAQGYQGSLEHFDSHEMMAARLRASVKAGDRVLLKGSRGMKMENVWKALQPE